MRIAYRQHCKAIMLKSTWFSGVPEELQELILDNSKLRSVEESQTLSHEGSEPTGFFLVIEGQVAITRMVGLEDGFIYHLGGPGFCFGETDLLSNKKTIVTATARTPVKVLFLSLPKYRQIISVQPQYYEYFSDIMVTRYLIVIRQLAQSRGLSSANYLRVRLADISDMLHADGYENDTVELALSQSDLAQMIGTSRQTINAILQDLVNKELVELSFRKIRITDPKRLRGEHDI